MAHAKSQKARIIVAFGDIEGFTSYLDAVTNESVELDPFMEQFDTIVDATEQKTGFYFRDTGDGFMCVVDLEAARTSGNVAVAVATGLWDLLKRIDQLREKMEHPRWAGFRIVIASGYVIRKMRRDGQITLRGRHINLAHNLLDIARGKGIVVHESFRALIPEGIARRHGITFESLPWPRNVPDNVPRKDANSLFVLTVHNAKSVFDRNRR